jgi:3'(2'), 5'-bisphosphate nucleotidase
MNKNELKNIAEGLIETFNIAGQESIDLYAKGLKIEIKEDNSPVSNGDIRVNDLITKRVLELTPNIPVVSEETVNFLAYRPN